jgi:hypothetical protein
VLAVADRGLADLRDQPLRAAQQHVVQQPRAGETLLHRSTRQPVAMTGHQFKISSYVVQLGGGQGGKQTVLAGAVSR